MTDVIRSHPLIKVVNQEVKALPVSDIAVVATGPLTSESLALAISDVTGEEHLFFYDAVAPIVTAESLNMDKVFRASRYGKGGDDYLNCPFTRDEYERFYAALVEADIHGASGDRAFFESCMPIEVMARRGMDSLLRPMPGGLASPGDKSMRCYSCGRRIKRNLYGLVGFQTRLRWREQERVFRLIPGLENADFVRYGVMHRNTYINSPRLLEATLHQGKSQLIFGVDYRLKAVWNRRLPAFWRVSTLLGWSEGSRC